MNRVLVERELTSEGPRRTGEAGTGRRTATINLTAASGYVHGMNHIVEAVRQLRVALQVVRQQRPDRRADEASRRLLAVHARRGKGSRVRRKLRLEPNAAAAAEFVQ